MLIYFRLVKAGFAPTVEEARKMNSREVLQALVYENFLQEYESVFMEMNK